MGARVLLVLLLLLHPVRGLVAGVPQALPTTPACERSGDCCPLCSVLDTCPCVQDDPEPEPAPEPLTRPASPEMARVLPGSFELIDVTPSDAAPAGLAAARAPSGMARTVGDFLSLVCVWTT
jgi:hypothetical protein